MLQTSPVWAWVGKLRLAAGSSPGRRQVAANSGWLLFDKLVRALLGLLVGAWVARHLGPDRFGMLAYVVAFIAMFQAVANFGADAIVVRDIAQEREAAADILGSTLALRLVAGLLCWGLAVACVALFNPGAPQTVWMAAIVGGVLVFQAGDTVDLWFQSQSQNRRTVVAKLCAYGLSNGVKVALILADAPLLAFAAVTTFDAAAAAVGLLIAYRHHRTPQRWRVAATRARRLVCESWPLAVSGASIMVYSRIDQIMVKELLNDRALGIYAAVLPLSQFWQVIPMTIATSLAPFMARRKLTDEASYRRAIVLTFRVFFYLGVASVALVWALSSFLIEHLFGPAYADAVTVLDVHALSNTFCFLGIAHGLWLVNERRFGVRLYGTLLAGLVSVGLNLLLLPRWGVVGAAWAATAAQFVAAFFINVFFDPAGFRLQCRAILFRKA